MHRSVLARSISAVLTWQVLKALSQGISVKKIGEDLARQTENTPPEPLDPRLG